MFRNKLIKYLLLSSFVGTAAESMLLPLYSMFVKSIGGGVLEAGLGYAIFSIIVGITVTISGKIKWFANNTHLLVLLGFLISGIGDFSYFFVNSALGLFFVQAILGVSVSFLNLSWDTIYSENLVENEEHKSWADWNGGVEIATGIAAIVGSIIVYYFGYKTMFIVTAIINTFAVYCAFKVYKLRK